MVSFRTAGEPDRCQHQAGGDPEGPGPLPGDQEADLPQVLLPVQRRRAGDPGTVTEPQSHAAAPEEVLRQHQEPEH